jgi:hypothetical protein
MQDAKRKKSTLGKKEDLKKKASSMKMSKQ